MAAAAASPLQRGSVAVVVGAGHRGVAYGVARLCLRRGMAVVVADVRGAEQAAAALRAEGFARVSAQACDVTDAAQCAALWPAAEAAGAGAPVRLLFNGVGVFPAGGSALTAAAEDWRFAFEVNVLGAMNLARALLPRLAAQRAGGRAAVVNTVSLAALTGGAGEPYVSSKAALLQATESLARELAERPAAPGATRVTAHALLPGVVDTQLHLSSVAARPARWRAPRRPAPPPPAGGSGGGGGQRAAGKRAAFAGDPGQGDRALSQRVFREMMALGLSIDECAEKVDRGLAAGAFYIVADNEPAMDVAGALASRREAVLRGAPLPPDFGAPPIIAEANRRARL